MNKDTFASHHEVSTPPHQVSSDSQTHVELEQHEHLGTTMEDDTADVLLEVGAAGGEKGGPNHGSLKLARDGMTVLVPQPSDDPNDPLNWSPFKKHMLLVTVALAAFLGDFGSAAGVACIIVQGEEWGISANHVNYAGNLNVIMLGAAGMLYVPLLSFWGRAPLLFWSILIGSLVTMGCAIAPNFETFYALRALMGITLTSGEVIGLSFIKDMFFFHEHARKIGIWAFLFVVAPYLAPLLANFMISGTGEWRIVFWLVFAICILDLLLILAFADETWYRRNIPISEQPDRGNRLMRLIGIWQIQNHKKYFVTLKDSLLRLLEVFLKPIMIPSMIYYCLSFMWAVGINITSSILLASPVSEGGYAFGAEAIGFVYFTPVVAVVLGEAFGHYFNDYLANRYIHKHAGLFNPEARLTATFVASSFMVPGLILVGQALEHHLNYSAIVMGWGMYVFGVMIASVAVTAYCLDCYQTGSGEVGGLINLSRALGGFSVGYFQQPWGIAQGYGTSFGIQAAVVGAATLVPIFLKIYGQRLRVKAGPLNIR